MEKERAETDHSEEFKTLALKFKNFLKRNFIYCFVKSFHPKFVSKVYLQPNLKRTFLKKQTCCDARIQEQDSDQTRPTISVIQKRMIEDEKGERRRPKTIYRVYIYA